MQFDEHGTRYSFDSISGFSLGSCAFAAYRSEPEEIVDARRMESWIVEPTESFSPRGERLVGLELGHRGLVGSVWYSPHGTVYATDLSGRLFVHHEEPDSRVRRWTRVDFGDEVALHCVWGFDDRSVYLLGRDAWRPRMWALTGGRFEPMPAPPGRMTMLRGVSPELLYAAGDRGGLARWDGTRWRSIRLPLLRNVTGLSASGPDDLWLTTDNGKLFEGTSHGWALRAQLDAPLYDVASWHGEVWIAAGPRGLMRLEPRRDRMRPASLDIAAVALDARASLMVLAPDVLASSEDGERFDFACRDVLLRTRAKHAPAWREH